MLRTMHVLYSDVPSPQIGVVLSPNNYPFLPFFFIMPIYSHSFFLLSPFAFHRCIPRGYLSTPPPPPIFPSPGFYSHSTGRPQKIISYFPFIPNLFFPAWPILASPRTFNSLLPLSSCTSFLAAFNSLFHPSSCAPLRHLLLCVVSFLTFK